MYHKIKHIEKIILHKIEHFKKKNNKYKYI
jgi:hypothetical protein